MDEAHTYFVGDGQWLVHNCGGGDVKTDFEGIDERIHPALELLRQHHPDYYSKVLREFKNGNLEIQLINVGIPGGMSQNLGNGKGRIKIYMTDSHATNAATLVHEITHAFQSPNLTHYQAELLAHQEALDFVKRANLWNQLDRVDKFAHNQFDSNPHNYIRDNYNRADLDIGISPTGAFYRSS